MNPALLLALGLVASQEAPETPEALGPRPEVGDPVPAASTLPLLKPDPEPEERAPRGRIEFRIRTKHGRGPVRCGLYSRSKDWLTSRYVFRGTGYVKGRMAVCVFEAVPPGRYAASAYHDANDNGDLDRNFVGLPTEDFCFSSGAKAGLGPPSFSDADFRFDGDFKTIRGQM